MTIPESLPAKPPLRTLLLRCAAVLGFWSLAGAVAVGGALSTQLASGCLSEIGYVLGELPSVTLQEGPPYLLWSVLSLPIVWITSQIPLTSATWLKALSVHALLLAASVLSVGSVRALAHDWAVHGVFAGHTTQQLWANGGYSRNAQLDMAIYGAVVASCLAFSAFRMAQDRKNQAQALERQSSELRAQLAEAKLQSLQSQIEPHFLFNTLNTVGALTESNPKGSRKTLSRLSELLRRALDAGQEQQVSLSRELRFLQDYLGIEQTRFGERFSVSIECSTLAQEALVPSMILQPLVENAVRHGMKHVEIDGEIQILGYTDSDRLHITVEDNGPGPNGGDQRTGIGLANTRERLETLFPQSGRLEVTSGASNGFRVDVTLPLRFAAEPDPTTERPN